MKTVNIYGQIYTVSPTCKKDPDLYWYDNNLTEVPLPNQKPSGYVKMVDNAIVAVYSKKPVFAIIGAVIAVAVLICGIFTVKTFFLRKVNSEGTMIKVDTLNNNTVAFNAIAACNGKDIDIRFTNGNAASTISIAGEGIVTSNVTVEPGESLTTIPVKVTTGADTVEATLTINTAGSMYTYPIIIECLQNMNTMGGDTGTITKGLSSEDHPFDEEYVFGIQ